MIPEERNIHISEYTHKLNTLAGYMIVNIQQESEYDHLSLQMKKVGHREIR